MCDLVTFSFSFRNQVRCVRQGKFKRKEISSGIFYANKMQHNEIYFPFASLSSNSNAFYSFCGPQDNFDSPLFLHVFLQIIGTSILASMIT